MSIRRAPLLTAMGVAIPLHAAAFALACYQFLHVPLGTGQEIENMRTTAVLSSVFILGGGSVISAFAAGATYVFLYASRYSLTMGAASWGTIVANELARLGVTIIFGCCPLTLTLQYIDYLPPDRQQTYSLLMLPFVPVILEIGVLIVSIPAAAMAGWLFASYLTRLRAAA